jgi:hypothetical protein
MVLIKYIINILLELEKTIFWVFIEYGKAILLTAAIISRR